MTFSQGTNAQKTIPSPLGEPMSHKSIKMQRKPMPQCPCLKIYTLEWNSFHQVSKQIQRSCNSLKRNNILCITFLWLYFDFQNNAAKYTKTNLWLIWFELNQSKNYTFVFLFPAHIFFPVQHFNLINIS